MQRNIKLVSNPQKSRLLGLLCILGYCLTYFGRMNYSAALADMLANDVLSKIQGGTIATIYFGIYGLGQIVNGVLADKYSPFNQVTIGLLGTGLCNIVMPVPQNYPSMLIIWGLNGYFQSLLWTPLLKIVATNLNIGMRRQAIIWLNASPAMGTAIVYMICSAILKSNSWTAVFTSAGASILVFVVIWVLAVRHCLSDCEYYTLEAPQKSKSKNGNTLITLLITSGAIFAFLPHMIHGMLKDGITTWAPTYLAEVFLLTPSNAVAITIILPMVGILGAPFASKMQHRLHNEFLCVSILFCITAVSLLLLILFGYASVFLSAILFAVVITCMHGINMLFVSFVPIRFSAYGKTSTVSGLMNATAHLGGALSMLIVASISQEYGWIAPKLLWMTTSVCSIFFCVIGTKKWGNSNL